MPAPQWILHSLEQDAEDHDDPSHHVVLHCGNARHSCCRFFRRQRLHRVSSASGPCHFMESDRISEALLKLTAELAIERGLSNAPLHAPDALSAGHRGEIAKVRASADKALPGIMAQLRQAAALTKSKQVLDEAESAYRDYMPFRSKVDENLVKPKQERSAEVVDTFAPTITNVIDRLNKIRLIMEALVTSPDATMMQLVQMRSLVAEMAEEAGRERAVFGGNIAQ